MSGLGLENESMVHFICKDLRPYNIVENVGFRWMTHTLEPRYVMPQRKYMANVAVPKMYEEVKQTVKTSLSFAQRVALSRDGLTSRATESYVTITSHHIDDKWQLATPVLQTRALCESHTGSTCGFTEKCSGGMEPARQGSSSSDG